MNESRLSALLGEFAQTLATDFPIQGILDRLVTRIVEILPVTAAGVTLLSLSNAPRYVSASDESALRFERLQVRIGQGPALTAFESGEPVAAPDLASDPRFTRFAPAARHAGLAAVFTFPMRHGDARLGALALYLDTPGELQSHDMEIAQTLADVAAAYVLNAQARDDARETSGFRHSALHDPLTGLPNRLMLQQRLDHAALRAKRSHAPAAVLFVDLDRFKQVNDSYGHELGDALLVAVAQRLAGLVRPGDTLARFSGDEFVFLCEDLHSLADAEVLASRIAAAFAGPFTVGGTELTITASIGMAYSDAGQGLSTQLLFDADIAMYQAKRQGGARHQTFDLGEARRMSDDRSLGKALRDALALGQLDVAYQPVVSGVNGVVTGIEALLRWTDPERGIVSAPAMVAAAEQSNLINDVGEWVLERACRDRADWLDVAGGSSLDLAVNVSGRQLMGADFAGTVSAVLQRTGTDPASLILEITEAALIEDEEHSATVLHELRAMGIRVALDDFGTGYSALRHLRRMPFDIVKIDRTIIADLDRVPAVHALVAAVTDLAHAVGLTVTVEGVETERQHDEIRSIGCDEAQGYFYAPPMSAFALTAHLAAAAALAERLSALAPMAR